MKTTMMIRPGLLAALWLSCNVCWAATEHSPWPGGIAVVRLPGEVPPTVAAPPTVTVDDKPALVLHDGESWVALIGIPLDQDHAIPLTASVSRPGAGAEQISVDVESLYAVARLIEVD